MVIDFSNAKAVDGVLDYCVDKQVPFVLCKMCIRDRPIVTFRWFCPSCLMHFKSSKDDTPPAYVNGIEKELVAMLGSWGRIPVTYAGGVSSFDDLKCIRPVSYTHLDVYKRQ